MDGLMDTCDAIFSRQDLNTRLKILSDTHAGSFAVMGCVIILMSKTFLFSELLSQNNSAVFVVPVSSRLGMAALLNNLSFAKSKGLAVTLGALRRRSDNSILLAIGLVLACVDPRACVVMIACAVLWVRVCIKIFGGITGDLLGAFVELSEIIMLAGLVIVKCI